MRDPSPDRTRALALYGTEEPVEPSRELAAGPLTVAFEAGQLRNIRWYGAEVLRAIAFVIRDTRWGTYAPALRDIRIDAKPDGFTVAYRGECDGPEGRFEYDADIVGTSDGSLRFEARGESAGGFATNRTGFVVLHGLEGAVKRPLQVRHSSGATSLTAFPDLVEPHQPVFDIAALEHEPAPGIKVAVAFEGDAFEMEDHRNWTDASFKTYVRPLARGFPYRLEPGEPLRQAVTLRVSGRPPAAPSPHRHAAILEWGDQHGGSMPRLGLFVEESTVRQAVAVAPRLAGLHAGYLQARVDVRRTEVDELLAQYKVLAEAAGCSLALDVVIAGLAPKVELAAFAQALRRTGIEPESLLITQGQHRSDPAALLAAARHQFPHVPLGGGVLAGFPELNRNRPPPGIDFVAHATQAIVHAADDRSVMETLEAVPDVIRTTRSFAGPVPYRLGPATIGMPAGWSVSNPLADPANRRTAVTLNDPRQRGLFAAAFMVGYVQAAWDVAGLTLAAPAGPFGLFHQAQEWPTPGDLELGAAYPAAEAFAGLAALSGRPRLAAAHDAPGRLAAVAGLGPSGGPALWLANLGAAPLDIHLRGPETSTFRTIDAAHLPVGLIDSGAPRSLTLDGYALACLS